MANKPVGIILPLNERSNNKQNNDTEYFYKNGLTHTTHIPFALEFKKIIPSTSFDYGMNITFDIPIVGNILYRSFLEIELPLLSSNSNLTDNIIKDARFIEYKQNKLSNITQEINYWTNMNINMQQYCNIMINGYVDAKNILKLNNITLSLLQSRILNIFNTYQDSIYKYKLLIDTNIISSIDILNYILGLTSMDINVIETTIDNMYTNINNYLHYYQSNQVYSTKQYNIVNEGRILCKWNNYLGHYYFNYFELNINGFTIDNYSNDYLHIKQLQNTDINYIDNYNKLIGNTNDIYINKGTPNIIYTPLIFSYCNKDESINALPLVGMNNSSIKLNTQINNLKNLLYLQDWKEMYDNLLRVEVKRKEHTINDIMNTITIEDLPYVTIDIIIPQYIYIYNCSIVDKRVLDIKYPGIDSDNILKYYGSFSETDNRMVLTLDNWIVLMNNITTDKKLNDNTKITLAGYHFFIDYNYILNTIPKPKISLLIEYGYIDSYERNNMATTQLDYIVETRHEIILDINNTSLYDSLNDINGLVKDIYIFTRPKLNKLGISKYGKADYLHFIASPNPIDTIELKVSNEYNLFEYYNTGITSYNNLISSYYNIAPLPLGVWFKTFALTPNTIQPSGAINMNVITGQNIAIIVNDYNDIYYNSTINPNKLGIECKIIYTKYNILKVKNGSANLMFYS